LDGQTNVKIKHTNFGSEAHPNTIGTEIKRCRNFEVSNCNWYCETADRWALGIGNRYNEEESNGSVFDCSITMSGANNYGISFSDMADNQKVDVYRCRIMAELGLTGVNLTGQAQVGHEDESPIRFYNNIISGNFDSDCSGIIIWNQVRQRSLLIANNIISGCSNGIEIVDTEEYEFDPGCYPFVYNNSIYNCDVGIKCEPFLDHGDDPYSGARIRNNTIMTGHDAPNNYGIAINENHIAGYNLGSMDDIDIANNILIDWTSGIFLDPDMSGSKLIDYNAFKLNGVNCSFGSLGDNCIVHDPDSEGDDERFHGQYIMLAEESGIFPWGNSSPNYHILLDEIEGYWDRNDNLINTGNSGENDEWLDPNWGIRQMRNINGNPEVITGLLPDMGVYGGPYSRFNIDDEFNIQDDPIYYTDGGFYGAEMPEEYYENWVEIGVPIIIPGIGNTWTVAAGTVINFPTGVEIAGSIQVNGGTNDLDVGFQFINGSYMNFTSDTDIENSYLNYLHVYDASYGIYASGLTSTLGDRLEVTNCTFTDCGVGVYANNSRLALTNTTITGSMGEGVTGIDGNGVYLTNCASGKVIIDNCDISGNGSVSTASGSGVFLSSSSPEIINTTIEDNAGGGVYCTGSSPDLNTYDGLLLADKPNTIRTNGGLTQSGSDGAEITLNYASYPDIQYNNIYDGGASYVGKMIYKDEFSNSNSISPSNNYWGTTPVSGMFFWGTGSAIDYGIYSGSELSNAEQFDLAMGLWDEGDFAGCAEILQDCIFDTGTVGVNSVHYLTGCVGEMSAEERQARGLSYAGLRGFLQNVAHEHQDPIVARVANRFATDCLTSLGNYEAAMEEYDAVRESAESLEDSVMAVVDYLAVYELASGHQADASGKSVQALMGEAFAALERGRQTSGDAYPTEFAIESAYPNPFNSTTRIGFALPEASNVKVTVHDLTGRQVAELASGRLEAGQHVAVWEADGVSAGVYFCKVEAGSQTASTKVMLVK